MTKVKKYRAPDMQDALAQIKAEMGSDAIILQSHQTKDGGVFGLFGKPVWEVVAAYDRDLRLAPEVHTNPEPAVNTTPMIHQKAKTAETVPEVKIQAPLVKKAERSIADVKQAMDDGAFSTFSAAAMQSIQASQMRSAQLQQIVEPDVPAIEALKSIQTAQSNELREIRLMLLDLREAMQSLRATGGTSPAGAGPLAAFETVLLDQGVDEADVHEIIEAVRSELDSGEPGNFADVRRVVKRQITSRIKASGPLQVMDGKCQVVFLTGPTGVGKTTTLVKIAANLILGEKRRVLLITTDTFRVAGVAQLQSYADIIGVELKVAYNPQELQRYVEENQDKDFILVDTPGHSPFDSVHLETLKSFLDAVEEKIIFLTLNSATKYADMLDAARSFEIDRVDGMVMTKVDETTSHGAILSIAKQTGKPLAYVTHGQNVPYDIQVAKPERLADLLLVSRDDS